MAEPNALTEEFLKELEKVKSLGTDTLKALALEFSSMEGNAPFLQSIKKATAILALKEKAEKKEPHSVAQRLLNVVRANVPTMITLYQQIEGKYVLHQTCLFFFVPLLQRSGY
jgi:hypothetical protein